MRVAALDHRLHGEAFEPRLGAKLGCALPHPLGGPSGLLRRVQPEPDAAHIRFVRDIVREDLDHNGRRLLEKDRGDVFDLLRRGGHPGGDRRNAKGRQHRLGFWFAQERASSARGSAHDGACRFVGDPQSFRFQGRRVHQCLLSLGVLPEIEEAFDRVGRRFISGDAGLPELAPSFRYGFLAEPVGQDRRQTLRRRRPNDGIDNGLRRVARRGKRGRTIHDENGVGRAVCKNDVHRCGVTVGRGIADDVDRISSRPVRGKHRVELGDHGVGQRSEPSARAHQIVDREHAGAAAIGHDQEAHCLRPV